MTKNSGKLRESIMTRRFVVGLALCAALAIPAIGHAHSGHVHKVMGTVSAVTAQQVDVKTTDGKTVSIALGAKTVYRQGKTKVDATVLKVGERVVVDAVEDKATKVMSAQSVQVAAPPATARK
jgi:hypothetical protein